MCPEDTPTATILILAADNFKFQIWRNITRHIHSIFNEFSDEIIDPELEIEPRCFPICFSHGIYKEWDVTRQQIVNQLDIFDWTGLECWRYGRCSDPMGNPPTIIIGIRQDFLKLHHTNTRKGSGESLPSLGRLMSLFSTQMYKIGLTQLTTGSYGLGILPMHHTRHTIRCSTLMK